MLAASLVTALTLLPSLATAKVAHMRRTPPIGNKTVIAQLFQWNWDSVGDACETSLGPAGYGYVQVSPPHEHIEGTEWWTDYQPVSYTVQSKRGSRAQFATMCERCNNAGVGVLADAVLNHMAGTGVSGTGVAGSTYSSYDFPAVPYTSDNFHAACAITDWTNATEVYDCQLDSLADLATETSAVQTIQAAYLNDLISLGVAGFRLDAARSMRPSDIAAWEPLLSKVVYIVQETTYSAGQASDPTDYVANGDVDEFWFGSNCYSSFLDGEGLSNMLQNVPGNGWAASDNALVFVDDHDTERTSGNVIYSSPNNAYTLAHIYMLAQTYGTPEVYSGYNFTSYDQGAPLDSSNNVLNTTCYEDGWRCEHQWTAIANMVGFHNAVAGTSITNQVITGTNQISFGRGSVGHLVMNYESSDWTITLSTDVPDGSYCDIIHDTNTDFDTCEGTFIDVCGGSFTVTVGAYDAVAFYV